jgi:hypothetical protein
MDNGAMGPAKCVLSLARRPRLRAPGSAPPATRPGRTRDQKDQLPISPTVRGRKV